MDKNTFVAWALHTGPAQPTELWDNSRWITGEWDGGKDGAGLKKDIDMRIDLIIDSFKFARKHIPRRGEPVTNYFVIPEFYFHCKYGPYPAVSIDDGKLPFEYICSSLHERLKNINLELEGDQKENWLICAGSTLTCNLPDIDKFLASDRVKERLEILNKEVRKLAAHKGYKTAKDFKKSSTRIKALSYMDCRDTLSEPQEAINALMDEFRAAPLCVVRNRGVLYKATFYGQSETEIQSWKYEKQNESTVDLTMGKLISNGIVCELDPAGMITEWMPGYPSISIINGDKNTPKTPWASRITIDDGECCCKALEVGVEVCLDHRLKRLRRTVGMTKENGAAENNPPIQVQLVPSGGMQILDYSVAAGAYGVIFNSDGCDPILDEYTSKGKKVIPGSGTFKQLTCGVYASSAQTMVKVSEPDGDEQDYYSHSQLSFRYGDEQLDGYNNALGTRNQNGQTFDPETKTNKVLDAYSTPKMIKLPDPETDSLFPAGLGDLHIYEIE